MNITLYENEAIISYIVNCVIFGVISAVIHCVFLAILALPLIYRHYGIQKLKNFISEFMYCTGKLQTVSDVEGIVIIASALLSVSFLTNSGVFRFISIPLLLIGFALGILIFKRTVLLVIGLVLWAINNAVCLLLSPALLLARCIYRVLIRIVNVFRKRMQRLLIERYTRSRYKDLDKVKQTGLLEHI